MLYRLYCDKNVQKWIAKSQVSPLKSCHLSAVNEDLYKTFSFNAMQCVEKHTTIRKHNYLILKTGAYEEEKYFLLERLQGQLATEACRWLTIGIGGITEAEKAFRQLFPKCEIYGIEANPDQAVDFNQFGHVIPHAVGPRHGNFTLRLLQKHLHGGYGNQRVSVRPLHEVLDEFVHSRLIHFATLDIEGVEYPILNELKYGGVFDEAKVIFCQIDVELHFGVESRHILASNFSFSAFYKDFLLNSPYVPVFATNFVQHRKVTFLHEHHPDCLRLFGLRKYYVKRKKTV